MATSEREAIAHRGAGVQALHRVPSECDDRFHRAGGGRWTGCGARLYPAPVWGWATNNAYWARAKDHVYLGRDLIGTLDRATGEPQVVSYARDHLGSQRAEVWAMDASTATDLWPYGALARTKAVGTAPSLADGESIIVSTKPGQAQCTPGTTASGWGGF